MTVLETSNLIVSASGTLPSVPFLALKDKVLGKRYDLSISFVSPRIAQKLNNERRKKDYVPDTLSFPLTKNSGEIILCMSSIKKEYKKHDMDLHTFLIFIVIHSMLHLKGYEHGSTMERKEKQFLKAFLSPTTHEATFKRRH